MSDDVGMYREVPGSGTDEHEVYFARTYISERGSEFPPGYFTRFLMQEVYPRYLEYVKHQKSYPNDYQVEMEVDLGVWDNSSSDTSDSNSLTRGVVPQEIHDIFGEDSTLMSIRRDNFTSSRVDNYQSQIRQYIEQLCKEKGLNLFDKMSLTRIDNFNWTFNFPLEYTGLERLILSLGLEEGHELHDPESPVSNYYCPSVTVGLVTDMASGVITPTINRLYNTVNDAAKESLPYRRVNELTKKCIEFK